MIGKIFNSVNKFLNVNSVKKIIAGEIRPIKALNNNNNNKHVLCLMLVIIIITVGENKFNTNMKQEAKLQFYICYSLH